MQYTPHVLSQITARVEKAGYSLMEFHFSALRSERVIILAQRDGTEAEDGRFYARKYVCWVYDNESRCLSCGVYHDDLEMVAASFRSRVLEYQTSDYRLPWHQPS